MLGSGGCDVCRWQASIVWYLKKQSKSNLSRLSLPCRQHHDTPAPPTPDSEIRHAGTEPAQAALLSRGTDPRLDPRRRRQHQHLAVGDHAPDPPA
ncbi:hypothetical protein CBM2617_B100225 [Cupriavidus taiwanensis]|nr:hypothetical protein CBM2617_B100225 [Cupriavidus taiwanensis]